MIGWNSNNGTYLDGKIRRTLNHMITRQLGPPFDYADWNKWTMAIEDIKKCGLALSTNNRTLDLKSPGHFFRIASFDFNRVSQYRVALLVPTSKKSSNKTPWASQKTVRSTLSAEGVVLNCLRTGDDGLFHSIDVTFASGVKWCTHNSSLVTIRNRKLLSSSWLSTRSSRLTPMRCTMCVDVRAPIVLTLSSIQECR
ncbi:hypothetical protein TNCV_1149431 [Trichonephila clavipes]|nr:hypothetical protein TNCV_1149431 [Trichonephila clavipes]